MNLFSGGIDFSATNDEISSSVNVPIASGGFGAPGFVSTNPFIGRFGASRIKPCVGGLTMSDDRQMMIA